jgi:adenosylmethionine-8-amino-7-oxononanoate aminotransferase
VEVGLKMALQAQRLRNETERTRFVAFTGAYHGDTVGAMSVGERGPFTEAFSEMLFDVDVLPYGDAAAATAYFREHGHQVVAAIVEPLVQGAAGMVFQSVQSLASLAQDVQGAGALLIADEVMTGWGRTGTLFAVEQAAVVPDILCCSKGITGGTLPLGLTACREHVFETFLGQDKQTAFLHGHSYTGNPIACAAALATLELFEEIGVLERVAMLESGYRRFAPAFAELPGVSGVRFRGGIFAFELPGSGGYFDPAGRRLADACFPHGLYIRPLGNVVYLMPPYCLDPGELDRAMSVILEQTRILLKVTDGRATTGP